MPNDEIKNLNQIEHVVVLMMENRSFDQMLGYLTQAGMPEVEGLSGEERNFDAQGIEHKTHEYGAGETAFHAPGEPLDKSLDPCHSPKCVKEQLDEHRGEHPGGFVKNFVAKKNPPADRHGLVMGHYTAQHLPAYDHLARQFCVCDHWHASIPGDTWPNRLYSLAGVAGEPVRPDFLHKLSEMLPDKFKNLDNIPIFDVPAFTRHLDESQWRWYSHDPATLRAADSRYRDFVHPNRDNFAFFDRKKVSFGTEAAESLIVAHDSFLDDAAKGELRDVSWIDPNFVDLSVLDPNSDDDHPPSDVRAGQALVLELYEALRKSPQWESTLLVIIYDEHGGFYDHLLPPAVDDGSGYATLGVRVPALVVGPRVKKFVCHQVFDHTSLIKTILLRFADDPDAALADMSERVRNAASLEVVLQEGPRTDIADLAPVRGELEQWRTNARDARTAEPQAPSHASDGAGQPLQLHDFQEDFVKFALAMRHAGLPAGQP